MAEQSEYESETEALQREVTELHVERREALENAFSALFATPNGELVLGYLGKEYRIHSALIVEGEELSPMALAMREGARLVVLDIIQRASALSAGIGGKETRVPKQEVSDE